MINKEGQQEMIGFVLIVVLVVVGLMVFLVISVRQDKKDIEDIRVSHILSSVLKYTTSCAEIYEPNYFDMEGLFKACYRGSRCRNLNVDACDYLNETLEDIMDSLIKSEVSISAYQVDFVHRSEGIEQGILRVSEGNCSSGIVNSAQREISEQGELLIVRARVCRV